MSSPFDELKRRAAVAGAAKRAQDDQALEAAATGANLEARWNSEVSSVITAVVHELNGLFAAEGAAKPFSLAFSKEAFIGAFRRAEVKYQGDQHQLPFFINLQGNGHVHIWLAPQPGRAGQQFANDEGRLFGHEWLRDRLCELVNTLDSSAPRMVRLAQVKF